MGGVAAVWPRALTRLIRRGLVPEHRQIALDRVEWLGAEHALAGPRADDDPALGFEAQHLERLRQRVDEPRMCHVFARINRELLDAVQGGRRRRDHFADPVWRDREVRLGGE